MLQFQWPPPDATPRGVCLQMNKVEQVSSDHHQMLLGRGVPGSDVQMGRGYAT